MFKTPYVSAAALCLLFCAGAHADSLYNLTLTSTSGTAGNGSGSFSINTPPPTTINSQEIYKATNTTGYILDTLSFTIGGDTFDLSDATGSSPYVRFTSGLLDAVQYSGSEKQGKLTLSFSSSGLSYNFNDQVTGLTGTGNITDALVPAAVSPEPSSLALLGTGLAAGIAALRRRRLA